MSIPTPPKGTMPLDLPVSHISYQFTNGLILHVPQLPAEVRDSDDTVSVPVRFAPTSPSFIHHDMTEFRYQFAANLNPGDPVPTPSVRDLLDQYNKSLVEFNDTPINERPSLAQPAPGPANLGRVPQ